MKEWKEYSSQDDRMVTALARKTCLVCNRILELRDEFPNPETMAIESQNDEIDGPYQNWKSRNHETPKITKSEKSKSGLPKCRIVKSQKRDSRNRKTKKWKSEKVKKRENRKNGEKWQKWRKMTISLWLFIKPQKRQKRVYGSILLQTRVKGGTIGTHMSLYKYL